MGAEMHPTYSQASWLLNNFLLFVRWQHLIARNHRELFSSNHVISHLYEACRIDDLSRGSVLEYEILTNN